MHQTISAIFELNRGDETANDVHIQAGGTDVTFITPELDAQITFDIHELFKALRNAVLEERGLL